MLSELHCNLQNRLDQFGFSESGERPGYESVGGLPGVWHDWEGCRRINFGWRNREGIIRIWWKTMYVFPFFTIFESWFWNFRFVQFSLCCYSEQPLGALHSHSFFIPSYFFLEFNLVVIMWCEWQGFWCIFSLIFLGIFIQDFPNLETWGLEKKSGKW